MQFEKTPRYVIQPPSAKMNIMCGSILRCIIQSAYYNLDRMNNMT